MEQHCPSWYSIFIHLCVVENVFNVQQYRLFSSIAYHPIISNLCWFLLNRSVSFYNYMAIWLIHKSHFSIYTKRCWIITILPFNLCASTGFCLLNNIILKKLYDDVVIRLYSIYTVCFIYNHNTDCVVYPLPL